MKYNDELSLFNEFREKWPLDRVKTMSLNDYTLAKRRSEDGNIDTFTYWLESKLDQLGSIWGGSSFKFGIYSRNDTKTPNPSSGLSYTDEYAWYQKYGNTPAEAFESVRREIITVIEAAQTGELSSIDAANLGDSYKWKIAFHYQPDISNPIIINIFSRRALAYLSQLPSRKISEHHRRIVQNLADTQGASLFDKTRTLWARYQESQIPEIADTDGKQGDTLNTIYYGPPGTGKTFRVLKFLVERDRESESSTEKKQGTTLDPRARYWHLAPGQGGWLWDRLQSGNRIGYQWCAIDHGDLKVLPSDVPHAAIIKRFAEVKEGDYFAIISGPKLWGLARATHDYSFEHARADGFEFQTVEVEWIAKFPIPVLLNATQTMTFCTLNNGSRWESFKEGLEERGFRFSESENNASTERVIPRSHLLATFHQSYSYEDFIEGIKPVMEETDSDADSQGVRYEIQPGVFMTACTLACQKAGFVDLQAALSATKAERKEQFENAQPFYIVIDEINRGNIANIFGELITLIEPDKRLGSENEVILDLPYSKARFGVPKNLMLIGTMNTADRSVEALDAALRRRFSFVGVYPDPTLIEQPEGLDIDLRKLLEAINARIEQVLDRDHTIGHSFLMGVNDSDDPLGTLIEVFKHRVVPQLQEYFYNAPDRLHSILGDEFVQEVSSPIKLFGTDNDDGNSWKIVIPGEDPSLANEDVIRAYRSLYPS